MSIHAARFQQSGLSTQRLAPLFICVRGKFLLDFSNYLYKIAIMNNLDAAFSALADPTRRAILARLAKGEATVNELAEPFEMTQPAISQHLKVLEDAGLIVSPSRGYEAPSSARKSGY